MQTLDVGASADKIRNQGRSFLTKQIDAQSTTLGNRLSTTANDLRRIAQDLRASETVSGGGDLADRGADAIDRVGSYLQSSDGEALLADAEEFARKRPWTVAALALVAGFSASRVLKASSARRYADRYGD